MAENLEKSKEQKVAYTVEQPVASPTIVGNVNVKEDKEQDIDELDETVEVEQEDDESDDTDEIVLDDDDEQEQETPKLAEKKAIPASKQDRKIQALKNEARKLQSEKAELERKLSEKKSADQKDELVKKYVDKGLDESEASERAESEIQQSTLQKQVASLMFEKQNRRILEKYPQADNDLERIMLAAKTGVMTVEEICRGLYGKEVPESERRALAALTDEGTPQEPKGAVASAVRSATVPQKSKLTGKQLELKRFLERKYKLTKPLTDEEVIKYYNAS